MFLLKFKVSQWYGYYYAILTLQNLNFGIWFARRMWELGLDGNYKQLGPLFIGWEKPDDEA